MGTRNLEVRALSYADKTKQRESQREWRRLHQDYYNQKRREARRRNRIIANGFKNQPCADCNQWYPPCVMDFDHVRGVKEAEIADLVQKATTVDKLILEIMKCEVVCANCHRIRTCKRLGQPNIGEV